MVDQAREHRKTGWNGVVMEPSLGQEERNKKVPYLGLPQINIGSTPKRKIKSRESTGLVLRENLLFLQGANKRYS
jgi:hypothetical protein